MTTTFWILIGVGVVGLGAYLFIDSVNKIYEDLPDWEKYLDESRQRTKRGR